MFKVIFCKVSTITNEKLSMSFTFNIQLLKHPQHNKDVCVQYIRMLENSAYLCTKDGWIGKYGGCRTKGTVETCLQSWSINTSTCAHNLRESDSDRGGDAHDAIFLATVVPAATRNWAAVIVRPYSCPSLAHLQLTILNATEVPAGKLQHWTPQSHPQESYNTGYHGGICRTLPPPASSLIVVQPAIQDPRYEGIAHHPSAPGSSNYDTCGSRAPTTLETRETIMKAQGHTEAEEHGKCRLSDTPRGISSKRSPKLVLYHHLLEIKRKTSNF